MFSTLEDPNLLFHGSIPLDNDYILLCARESRLYLLNTTEAAALRTYLLRQGHSLVLR